MVAEDEPSERPVGHWAARRAGWGVAAETLLERHGSACDRLPGQSDQPNEDRRCGIADLQGLIEAGDGNEVFSFWMNNKDRDGERMVPWLCRLARSH